MSHSPRVSVVIPTYNRAADLARCLESLLTQTFPSFEVLVCDDGSTDHTAEVVDRYSQRLDLHYHWAENFGGPARPRNAGLRLARGRYIAFLDSDDWWKPRKLERSVRQLDAGADLVYHDLLVARSPGQRIFLQRRRTWTLRFPVFEDLLARGNAIANSSVVMRRELLCQLGGFSEDRALIAWEDFDAWLRLARITERFVRVDEPLGYYWQGSGNISSPQRRLEIMGKLDEMYFAGDPRLRDAPRPGWFYHALGLAHNELGSAAAAEYLWRALRRPLPPAMRARASLALMLARVRGAKRLGRRKSNACPSDV